MSADVERTLGELLKGQEEAEERDRTLFDKIDKINDAISGNGTPGLKTRVSSLEEWRDGVRAIGAKGWVLALSISSGIGVWIYRQMSGA